MLISGVFEGRPKGQTKDIDRLSDELSAGKRILVDRDAIEHFWVPEDSTVQNAAENPKGGFAGKPLTEREEVELLSDAIYSENGTLSIDGEGIVHLENLDQEMQDNGVRVKPGSIFAGEPMTAAEEMSQLADALYNGDSMVVDRDGVVHLEELEDSTVQNGAKIPEGSFAGNPLTAAEEMSQLADALYNGDSMVVDRDGVVHLEELEDSTVQNGAKIPEGSFAAQMPTDPEQWYNKNSHRLFRTEVAAMKKFFPKAGFSFMQSTGNMYWVVDLKVSQTGFAQNWRFMLVYDKNHPHNNNYGGSIKVCPIKPNEADLRAIAKKYGRPGVPHLLHDSDIGTYLCTRRTQDVKDGTSEANSAVSVTSWAADWALHFELGIRDKKVWNKWCDDAHFRSLMV